MDKVCLLYILCPHHSPHQSLHKSFVSSAIPISCSTSNNWVNCQISSISSMSACNSTFCTHTFNITRYLFTTGGQDLIWDKGGGGGKCTPKCISDYRPQYKDIKLQIYVDLLMKARFCRFCVVAIQSA